MAVMLVVCLVFLNKNNISVKNVDALTQYLTGGTLTVALILIGFSVVKSFALVFIFKAGGLLPSDLSSLIFGAMNIPFGKYFVVSNLGLLILNLLWTIVGTKGDLSNPYSYLYALPALLFAIVASVVLTLRKKKKCTSNK